MIHVLFCFITTLIDRFKVICFSENQEININSGGTRHIHIKHEVWL